MIPLFFAGELESFNTSGDVSEVTTAGSYDSTYARCSIRVNTDISYADSIIFPGATPDFFFGAQVMLGSFTTNRAILGLINSSGVETFRVVATGTAAACTLQMQYLLAGVWTNVGSTATADLSTRKALNIQLTMDGNGSATLYVAGASVIAATGTNLTSIGDVARIRLRSAGVAYWSEVAGALYTLVGKRVVTRYPSANGADTAWTGDYTAVDETAYSAADYIQADAPNLSEAFITSGGSTTNTTINAVAVAAKTQSLTTSNATSADSVVLGVRSSGESYYGQAITPTILETPHREIWTTNPATSAAWQSVDIANLQPVMKSLLKTFTGTPPIIEVPTDLLQPEDRTFGGGGFGKHIY